MNEFRRIYEKNKALDVIYLERYGSIPRYVDKCAIELLVELGEFVNETKVFKFWSIKKPNMDNVLEEYADVITMILVFFNFYDMEIEDTYSHISDDDILNVINYIYKQASLVYHNCSEKLIKDIFGNMLYLAKLLELDEADIIKAIDHKHKILEERLESDY